MARNNGLAEMRHFLNELVVELEHEAKETVKEYTLKTVRDAKTLAVVDTGYMRNNIKDTYEDGGLTGIVTSNADYSIFIEFGTSRMPPRPFLFPSFDRNSELFYNSLKRIGD